MTAPVLSVRPLVQSAEFDACAALEREIWGVAEADSMSRITMHALAMDHPRLGLLLGAFADAEMVGLAMILAAFEPATAYGHSLGVLPRFRDTGVGSLLQQEVHGRLRAQGVRWFCYTFDPLESRNAHLYLNRQGAIGVAFKPDAYGVSGAMHGGLPMDRFLAEVDFDASPRIPPTLEEALGWAVVATPERMPEAPAVLVEVPAEIGRLRREDHAAALAASHAARALFTEYIARRGLVAVHLVRGDQEGVPRSYILLAARKDRIS